MKIKITHRRKVREQTLSAECPDCGASADWKSVTRTIPQEFRNRIFEVQATCHECVHCGFRILTDSEQEGLRRETIELFQEQAGLLTALELTQARERMGWSQAELAKHTGLGIASIKRWESGLLVQTEANDRVLRQTLVQTLSGEFRFLFFDLGHVQIQCYTETWQDGWEMESHIKSRSFQSCNELQCFDSSLVCV